MFIGEVVGTVVASQKTDNMNGLPLRIIRRLTPEAELTETYAVAVDVVGASHGEYVLIATGSSARQTQQTDTRPVDAIIMAIVDTWQVDGQVRYTKQIPLETPI
ncbi:MAG: EutN/CcmL family microcompartment protein [Anaerolineae bacterium]|nr:EutN/CcmL family microcompartment protein [Anaerolineae bacterium]